LECLLCNDAVKMYERDGLDFVKNNMVSVRQKGNIYSVVVLY